MTERTPQPPPENEDRQSFLQRWSRLKAAAGDGQPAATEPPAEGAPETGTEHGAATGSSPVLPDVEQLDQDSDYSAFLAPEVDPLLRRLALRKLFRSPKFNVCDGLDDYCDDFTRFAPLGSTVTADMRNQLERAARQALAAVEDAGATPGSPPEVQQVRDHTTGAAGNAPGESGAEDASAKTV